MIRFVMLLFLVATTASAQDKINSVSVKKNTKVPTGWTCFDEPSMKKIDVSQKRGLDCLKSLQEAKNTIDMLKRENEESEVIEINDGGRPLPFYHHTWVKVSAAALLGIGLGVAVGINL